MDIAVDAYAKRGVSLREMVIRGVLPEVVLGGVNDSLSFGLVSRKLSWPQ